MNTISDKLSEDKLFHSAYKKFVEKFPDYQYESSLDAMSVSKDKAIFARLFFLKDLSNSIRLITCFVSDKTAYNDISEFVMNELKEEIRKDCIGIYEKADLELTTFKCQYIETNIKDMGQTMKFVVKPD